MTIRHCKIALVAAVAFFLLLVVFNNLTDYGSNYGFVEHVLSMDTTFEGNQGMWRAITSPVLHHAFYWSIIAWELVAGVMIAAGAWSMWSRRSAEQSVFTAAKRLAVLGLTLNLLQWFVAFLTVGAEWFLMWQSSIWNGQDAAFRMFACVGIILLFVNAAEGDAD